MVRKVLPKIKRHKPTVIIIEGCDLSGKTTFCHELAKEYTGVVVKITERPKDASKSEIIHFKKYINSLLDYVNHNRQTKMIIFDRFFPSEMVYSKIMRGYDASRDLSYRDFEKVILAKDHIYIYCDPGVKTLMRRYKERGDEYISEGHIRDIYEGYNKFFEKTAMNKIRVDTNLTNKELVEQIKTILQ